MNYKISLAAARVNAGLTQESVARQMKVSKSTIVSWEKGTTILKPAQFEMFCRICGCPQDIIFLHHELT